MTRCKSCESEIPKDSYYCNLCGTDLRRYDEEVGKMVLILEPLIQGALDYLYEGAMRTSRKRIRKPRKSEVNRLAKLVASTLFSAGYTAPKMLMLAAAAGNTYSLLEPLVTSVTAQGRPGMK